MVTRLRNIGWTCLAAVLYCSLTQPWAVAQSSTSSAVRLPSDVSQLVSTVRSALADRKIAEIAALSSAPAGMDWLRTTGRGAEPWQFNVVSLAGSAKQPSTLLAVFGRYIPVESTGDRIYPVIRTPNGLRLGDEILETDTRGFRVRDHALQVRIDPPKSACSITDLVTIERLPGNKPVCLLRLSADMKVESVLLNDKPLVHAAAPGLIAFVAPKGPARFKLRMKYGGVIKHGMGDYILENESVMVSYWYPHIARLPATHSVAVTVPTGWTAVGQGEPQGTTPVDGGTEFKFRNSIPTCFFSLDTGKYTILTRESRGRRYSTYMLQPNDSRSNSALDTFEKAMEFFEKSFGPYPYSHYELVQTLGPFPGALEAYSFATYAGGNFGAVVHELAHTWWGGIVPNPYTRTLWNESFAVYSDGLFSRQTAASPPARALSGQHRGSSYGRGSLQSFAIPINVAHDALNGRHSAVGYGKGSLVMRMLEDILGTGATIKSMKRFRDDLKKGEAADWPDFARAVQKTTGKDLKWFWDQWLSRPGVPEVRLTAAEYSPSGSEFELKLTVVQAVPAYKLPRVPVRVEFAEGEAMVVEVDLNGPSTTLSLRSPKVPTKVTLDPEGNVLMAGSAGEGDPFVASPTPAK